MLYVIIFLTILACDCNPGGSLSNICEKKSGQCRCRPNVTGRRCDRSAFSFFYFPLLFSIFCFEFSTSSENTLGIFYTQCFVDISLLFHLIRIKF